MEKTVSILGSTGSIGTQTLEVCRHLDIKVDAVSGYNNVKLLEEQCRCFNIRECNVSAEKYTELKLATADLNVKITAGEEALCELAYNTECDAVVSAIVGIKGLKPTLSAIYGGAEKHKNRDIILANKETLITHGEFVMKTAKALNVRILPADSEHSAIFQCLDGKSDIKKLILTASGGPFFGYSAKQLKNVSLAEAMKHPTYSMGKKITVDSATMMNKALELIEAVHLFGVSEKNIDILIHRESIVHSMVEFNDNTVIAQMANPDMRLCLQYAITYPHRHASLTPPLDLTVKPLTFAKNDDNVFIFPSMARAAVNEKRGAAVILNAANEQSVELYLGGKIKFYDIFEFVQRAYQEAPRIDDPDTDAVAELDKYTREIVSAYAKQR